MIVDHICAYCGSPFKAHDWKGQRFCSKSCGAHVSKNRRHGLCYSLEHRSWRNMIDRCTNPRCKYWPDYGGRGISVCDRWMTFENFYADLGPKPTDRPRYSIERIDNSKGYEPGNCKWATPKEQNKNRRGCWTPEEDEKLRQAIDTGVSLKEVSKMLGKPAQYRAYRIGLKSKYDRQKRDSHV